MTAPLEPAHSSPLDSTLNENVLQVAGHFDPSVAFTEFRLSSGEALRIPTSLLAPHLLPPQQQRAPISTQEEALIIPVIEERLVVEKRTLPKAEVRLQKIVEEYQQTLDESLTQRTFAVERIPHNRLVDAPPPIRQEGNTTIYSLVEEQLVLTKQLLLKEEIRITQHDTQTPYNNIVNLRREQITIDRVTY